MTGRHAANKVALLPLRKALYDFRPADLRLAAENLVDEEASCHFAHPIGDLAGRDLCDAVFMPLANAWPDLERREYIVVAGADSEGIQWVGCAGSYVGTFVRPWLEILPTGHIAHMRFHEFFRLEQGRVLEIQALWDIPEVMMQAGAWPMGPSLGREWHVPGPASQDGVSNDPYDEARSAASCQLILNMLEALKRHPKQGGPEVMEMEKYWHPRFNWYGPAGIGSGRGMAGFRNWHQIPFLNAMPDRGKLLKCHFFADCDYVAVTGWPNMEQTLTGDGWLGIAPTGQKMKLRSLDFWRVEDSLIRENWVLVDLLHAWHQLGVDVLGRMREFNKARNTGSVDLPVGTL